jgi:hypothetical protein
MANRGPKHATSSLAISHEIRKQVNLTPGSHVTPLPTPRQGMTMTDKDRETIRELVRLEHLLMDLPGDPRPRLTVAGQGGDAGLEIRLAEVIPFRARGM